MPVPAVSQQKIANDERLALLATVPRKPFSSHRYNSDIYLEWIIQVVVVFVATPLLVGGGLLLLPLLCLGFFFFKSTELLGLWIPPKQTAPGFPIVGHLFHFLINSQFLRNPAAALLALAPLDKDGSGVVVNFGIIRSGHMLVVTNPDRAHECLNNSAKFLKGPGYDAFRLVTPKHLPGLDGAEAMLMRKIYIAAVTPNMDKIARTAFNYHFNLINRLLETATLTSRIEIGALVRQTSLLSIFESIFGFAVLEGGSDSSAFVAAVHFLMEEWHERVITIVPFYSIPGYPRNTCISRAHDIIAWFIQSRAAQIESDPGHCEECVLKSLVVQGVSAQMMTNVVFTFIAMGHENVSSSVAWVWYHMLSATPALLGSLTSSAVELKSGVAAPHDLTYSQLVDVLSQESPISNFMNEVLRLYPAVPLLSRIEKDDTKGEELLICPYVLQRLNAWPTPEKFEPDRWASVTEHQRRHFIPFGLGDRGCLGHKLGRIQMLATIVSLSQSDLWGQLQLDVSQPVNPFMKISLRPSPIHVTLRSADRLPRSREL